MREPLEPLEVLLVSDDPPFEAKLRGTFQREGHRVTTCVSMPGTFEVLTRAGTTFDLIVIASRGASTFSDDAARYARWLGTRARVEVVDLPAAAW